MADIDRNAERDILVITGDVGAPSFVPWIERHARKLGLSGVVCRPSPTRIEVEAQGPEEMLDAMQVGCLLGPKDVWVDDVQRSPCPDSD